MFEKIKELEKKKKEIAEAMVEIIAHVSESLGKAYGCYIETKTDITITPNEVK